MSDEKNNIYEEDLLEKPYDSVLMKRLIGYAKPFLSMFIIATLLLFASTLADLIRPYLIKVVIDNYLNRDIIYYQKSSNTASLGNASVRFEGVSYQRLDKKPAASDANPAVTLVVKGSERFLVQGVLPSMDQFRQEAAQKLTKAEAEAFRKEDFESLNLMGLVFIGTIILGFLLSYLQIYILSAAGQRIIYNIRQEVFTHIQRLPLSYFDKTPVGRLVTRVTNDTEALNEMYVNVFVSFFKDISIFAGVLIFMFLLDIKLALVMLISMPFVVVATLLFRAKARVIYRNVRVTLARINAVLSENISGMRVIQLFNAETRVLAKFQKDSKSYFDAAMSEIKVFGMFRPVIDVIATLSVALLIWYGGGQVLQETLEFGVLFAFINYVSLLFQPISDFSEKFNVLQSAMAASERIFGVLDTKVEPDDGALEKTLTNAGQIEFQNVSFSYIENQEVLRDVSFDVEEGETVAIVGATGSGKTTIVSLLNRFYEITQGRILLNGTDIQTLRKDQLRRMISYVPQDVFMFTGTIKENIRLGDDSIPDEEIEKISRYINASQFIEKFPKGYDQPVVERGETLSTGQRQLLSFARALVQNPKVLILDEATANIDTETEGLIQDALLKLTKGRTTLIIAHRLSTIQAADKIIVLHKGKIREVGNHQALLNNKGHYYNLYQLWQGAKTAT